MSTNADIAVLYNVNSIIAAGVLNGKARQVNIPSSNPLYKKAVAAYKAGNNAEVLRLGDISTAIESFSDGKFFVLDGEVYTEGADTPAPKILSTRIIAFAKDDLPVEPLLNFWTKLQNNVSPEVQEQLYGFLEHNNIPLTADGCFVGYKSVTRADDGTLWDTYTFDETEQSGTYCNNVGETPEMDREEVDDNPNQTCSQGLHVAAHNYAQHSYGGGNRKVMVHVKVDPADVVSVPTDYNGQKMRVCKYTVIAEAESDQPIERPLYDDDEPEVDDDLQNEEDIYDATEDDDYDEEIGQAETEEINPKDCKNCDFEDCPDREADYEPSTDVSDENEGVDVTEVKPRFNGSVELPVNAVLTMGVGTQVSIVANPTAGTVALIPCEDDEDGCRTLRKGFRIAGQTMALAEIEGHGAYIIEATENVITISVR